MSDTNHPGGCACGAVRYSVREPANNTSNCHCRQCQMASGAPFISWADFPQTQVEWLKGHPKWFRSSEEAERGFCELCGTTLTFRYVDSPNMDIAVATLDDPTAFPPEKEIWTQSRLHWVSSQSAVAQFPKGRTEPSKS